ncbi:MAG: type III secretion inner membrane ring lipoprotein SctJ [Planctomycetota bacterium]|jgi:type III secretion protein J|nr:type III secretion inner membrane ring lipoprotein SctJ [Planctomycetota bacterium]
MPSPRGFLLYACLALAPLLAGCQTQLFGSLSENEANAVMAALLDASLSAEKRAAEEGLYSVFVEESDFAAAVRLLNSLALPGRNFDSLGTVFGKGAMFSTPMEEKARYLYAMQEDLTKTVSEIDGVLAARVHLVLAEQDQLGREIHGPSAAVFVKHVDDDRHDPVAHRLEIRRLVAASVPNLDEDRIVVNFFPVPPLVRPEPRPPAWRVVLGLRVAPESEIRLWGMVAGAAGLGAVLAGLAFSLFRRKAKK